MTRTRRVLPGNATAEREADLRRAALMTVNNGAQEAHAVAGNIKSIAAAAVHYQVSDTPKKRRSGVAVDPRVDHTLAGLCTAVVFHHSKMACS
jgi:hypothetical protein